ncbi:MAG: hypothetical protein Q8K75_07650 [Chlamydiales bacterium]|nr:hypothetical protein [Chlamydiales bacterium]
MEAMNSSSQFYQNVMSKSERFVAIGITDIQKNDEEQPVGCFAASVGKKGDKKTREIVGEVFKILRENTNLIVIVKKSDAEKIWFYKEGSKIQAINESEFGQVEGDLSSNSKTISSFYSNGQPPIFFMQPIVYDLDASKKSLKEKLFGLFSRD